MREFHNQANSEAGGEKGKEEKERQGQFTNRGDKRRDNRGSRFSRYTLLTTERGRILDEALNAELILLKMVVAPSRHVFDENICVHFMYIYICFKYV